MGVKEGEKRPVRLRAAFRPSETTLPDGALRKPLEILSLTRAVSAFLHGPVSVGPLVLDQAASKQPGRATRPKGTRRRETHFRGQADSHPGRRIVVTGIPEGFRWPEPAGRFGGTGAGSGFLGQLPLASPANDWLTACLAIPDNDSHD